MAGPQQAMTPEQQARIDRARRLKAEGKLTPEQSAALDVIDQRVGMSPTPEQGNKVLLNLPDGGRVEQMADGKFNYVNEGYSTIDQKEIRKILTGRAKPPQNVTQGVARDIIEKSPIGALATKYLQGIPFAGQFVDEAMGRVAPTPEAQAKGGYPSSESVMREVQSTMQEEKPIASTVAQVAGGVLTTAPLLPLGAPSAAAGGASPMVRLIQGVPTGAALGAAEGATAGYGAGETPEERARLAKEGAQFGGIIGGALPIAGLPVNFAFNKFAESVRYSSHTPREVSAAMRDIGVNMDPGQAREFMNRVAATDWTAAERILKKGGSTATLGDAFKTLVDRGIVEGGPNAREAAQAAMLPRAKEVDAKVTKEFDRVFGQPRDLYDLVDEVQGSTVAPRKQAYGDAYAAAIPMQTPEAAVINKYVRENIPVRILQQVNEDLRLAGGSRLMIKFARNPNNRHRIILNQSLTVQQVDKIVRRLDDMAEAADRKVDPFGVVKSEEGVQLSDVSRTLRTALRRIVPEYDKAVSLGRESIQARQAIQMGDEFFKKDLTRGQVLRAVTKMRNSGKAGLEELKLMKEGVRSRLDELMTNARRMADDPDHDITSMSAALKELGREANEEKLRILLGNKEAEALLQTLDEADAMLAMRAAIAKGSQTAERTTAQGGNKARTVLDLYLSSQPGSATQRMFQLFTGRAPEMVAARDQQMMNEIVNILMNTSGKTASDALNIVRGSMKGAPINKQQADIVARALSQSGMVGTYTAAMENRRTEQKKENAPLRYNADTGEIE
jgi:hypothetical protein